MTKGSRKKYGDDMDVLPNSELNFRRRKGGVTYGQCAQYSQPWVNLPNEDGESMSSGHLKVWEGSL